VNETRGGRRESGPSAPSGARSKPGGAPGPGPPKRPHRPGPTIDDDPRWTATAPDRPCPVCGDTSGACGVAIDQRIVDCRMVPSEHPLEGDGWLHHL
jgi:hypothetical protein